MPKVSVVIPTHNRPEFLKRAIHSVLAQTFQDFEIVVVSDGIDEKAQQATENFKEYRLKYFHHEVNRGAPAARNTGIKNATGELIAFLDDDDEWLPEKLELQVKAMNEHTDVGLCFCGVEALTENSKRLFINIYGKDGLTEPYLELLDKPFIWTSSIVARNTLLKDRFLFDEDLPKNQEWDLTLRLTKVRKSYSINKVLVKLHIHGGQMGGRRNLPNRIVGYQAFIKKHIKEYKKVPSSLSLRYAELALLYKENKQRFLAMNYFIKAFMVHPEKGYMRGIISLMGGAVLKKWFKWIYSRTSFAKHRNRKKLMHSIINTVEAIYGDTQTVKNIIRDVQRKKFVGTKSSFGYAGDFEVMMLYILTRMAKPKIVVETGVASGRSSWAILEALRDNNKGKLYSIDLAQFFKGDMPATFITESGRQEFVGFIPEGQMPGWLIPPELKDRWTLILGKSSEKLPLLLSDLAEIDIFYHDSDHSYGNMMFEFETAWPYISNGGFLLSDDVKWNDAFTDLMNKNSIKNYQIRDGFGITIKK